MFEVYGESVASRFLLGTAQYPSPQILSDAVKVSGAEILTVSLRRETAGSGGGGRFWDLIREMNVKVLPNTAGCHSVKEAVTTAKMARDLFGTDWIKLEVIGHHDSLQPDVFGLVEAARILSDDGFKVFPYTTDDIVVGDRLLEAGCQVLMPWCAPIGSAKGRSIRMPFVLIAVTSEASHLLSMPVLADRPMRPLFWNSVSMRYC